MRRVKAILMLLYMSFMFGTHLNEQTTVDTTDDIKMTTLFDHKDFQKIFTGTGPLIDDLPNSDVDGE